MLHPTIRTESPAMKTILSPVRIAIFACLFVSIANTNLHAQDKDVIELTLHACSVPDNPDAIRLLPRESELRDGNAAIELLRLPWEQVNFMKLKLERMSDWLEMDADDPELLRHESTFEGFKNQMRRAAYTSNADWDYPIGEQPLSTIWLPDVQGMRGFCGRVMSLWIRIQIKKGNLKDAQEGLLIQMACARHISRSPIVVCQLVGAAIARIGFDQFEDLIQHRDSENFYYALSMLPDTLGNFKSAIDIESTMVRTAMPSLAGSKLPPTSDARWKSAFNELHEYFIDSFTSSKGSARIDPERQAEIAAKELLSLADLTQKEINTMSDEEIFVRWFLASTEQFSARYIAAIQLPKHLAIQELLKIEKETSQWNKKIAIQYEDETSKKEVSIEFYFLIPSPGYLGCHRFGRTAKLLQIVEAIRHYASKHDNRLPKSLADIDLALPVDPFTNKQAVYDLVDGTATLSWPPVDNIEDSSHLGRSYKIKMATKEKE